MKRAFAATFALKALLPALLSAQISHIVVTDGASFEAGLLPAPGSIGTIFCTGLSVTGVVSAPGTPLPQTLAGVTVTVGGAQAPLFAVADLGGYQQINFQVPHSVQLDASTGTANVVVSQGEAQSVGIATPVNLGLGAFFRVGATPYGLFQHGADYSLVTTSNPAKVGEVIVGYATGLNPPNPYPPDGQATPMSPLYPVPQNDTNTINMDLTGVYIKDSAGQVNGAVPGNGLLFMGLAPGMVGVYQINLVMPFVKSGMANIGFTIQYCVPGPIGGCQQPGAIKLSYGSTVSIPVL